MIQWHPIFAKLLRPLLEGYYDVRTGVPVGDAPRQADLVLIRRTTGRNEPFTGLWRNLTTGNVLEFKGPTVSPRRGDLDLLIELGLGIHRRLNAERTTQGESAVDAREVSFWYLANRLGRRFLRTAKEQLDNLEPWGAGVWRCQVLRRLVFLVSGADVPVERDSLPLHVLARESPAAELEVARLVGSEPPLWKTYGEWVLGFHPAAVEELQAMARTATRKFKFHIEPFIQLFGLEEVIRQIGPKRVIDQVGLARVIEEVGLDRVIEEVGPDRVIDQVGPDKVIKRMGMDEFVASLTPAQRRELRRRLQKES